MIKVNQLNKYFNRRKKNEIHVLNDVTVEFPEKGLVVLLGPSGSGKTTLLNVLGGLDKVQSGTIDFDGEKIMGYDVHAWDKIRNEHVGYIFQNYNLLPELSVYDNIAFVLKMMGIKDPEIIDKRVTYILNAVHMYPFRKKKALQLSGGQQQRVAIARALVKNPKVIIADEPTGNLDSKNTLDIMNIIKQISREKLVVLVTHEKQLATFYGDRILEVKDGRIISDFENESKEDGALGKDDTIFLKDYNHIADHENHGISLALYSDHEDDLKDVSIKLIVKNETLYLDVKSPYNKIKFVDKNAGVVIRDEHYVKKTKEELIETSFETEKLDNVGVERQSKTLVSIKQSLWMAFQKVLKTSRKGKLMLFSFFVAGMVIAVTVAMLSAVAILKPEQHMQMPKGYIKVNVLPSQQFKESELMAFKKTEDDIFYINAFSSGDFYFINPNGDKSKVFFNGQIEIDTHVNKKDLVFGRLPANDAEIMISSSVADGIIDGSFFQGAFGQEIGIWSYDHLTKEVVDVSGVSVKIVGIVKSELKLVYMPENLATLYTSLKNTGWLPYRYFSGNIIAGSAPSKGEVLITKEQYSSFFGNSDFSGTYPKTVPVLIPMFPYLIAGVVDNNSVDGFFFGESHVRMIALNEDLNKLIIESSYNLYIYTSRSNEIVKEIEDSMTLSNMYKVSDVYQDALENAKARRVEVILPTLTTSAFLIGFAMLGFYFVIRSSLISRIYEVSVFRALGVKKNDIFISFLVEIFVLTTITTFIGYSIASLGLSKLSGSLIGQFNLFTVNPLTFVLGLIIAYVINMLAGILPVYLLLRKTPAQILAQYDI